MTDVNKGNDIVISNEEDAYAILKLASQDKIGAYDKIIFNGWPSLSLYIKGDKFDQSLTPTIMKGLIELQRGVYRSYSVAKFGNSSRRLSEEERDDLEIKVSVQGGSSSLEINFPDIATKLVEQLGARMNPTELLIAVVSIAVLYFGNSSYRSYLQSRKEIRLREISDETQRHALEILNFSSEQETKRTAIIADLVKQDPRIGSIDQIAHDTHTEIIKSMAAGKTSKIGDIEMTPMISETLTHNARRTSSEVRLDGAYRILKLDWSNPVRFKVKVKSVDSALEIDAEIQDDSLTGQYKEAIKTAEWSRRPVNLKINAKLIGESEYREAIIISAIEIPIAPDGQA